MQTQPARLGMPPGTIRCAAATYIWEFLGDRLWADEAIYDVRRGRWDVSVHSYNLPDEVSLGTIELDRTGKVRRAPSLREIDKACARYEKLKDTPSHAQESVLLRFNNLLRPALALLAFMACIGLGSFLARYDLTGTQRSKTQIQEENQALKLENAQQGNELAMAQRLTTQAQAENRALKLAQEKQKQTFDQQLVTKEHENALVSKEKDRAVTLWNAEWQRRTTLERAIQEAPTMVTRFGDKTLLQQRQGGLLIAEAVDNIIRDAKQQNRSQTPPHLLSLIAQTPRQMGGSEDVLTLIAPIGTGVMEARPTFAWNSVDGAIAYDIMVFEAGKPTQVVGPHTYVPAPPKGFRPIWKSKVSLPHGKDLEWRVTAIMPDHKSGLSSHKRPDDRYAPFYVLNRQESDALHRVLKNVGDDPIRRAVILWNFGLLDEAESLLQGIKEGPSRDMAQRMLENLRSVRNGESLP